LQIRIDLKFSAEGISRENTKCFEIDYSEVDTRTSKEIVGQIVYGSKICQIAGDHLLLMKEDGNKLQVTRVV